VVNATPHGMQVYTRTGGAAAATVPGVIEQPYEKVVLVPAPDDQDPARHAWADARFATDIMAEHALFFALLMPPELAATERAEALRFHTTFRTLFDEVEAAGPPPRDDLPRFVGRVVEQVQPFIEYKARLGEAQRSGALRSLVWPLFFDHTRHEAERWTRRLQRLARREPEFERTEVVGFWSTIMDEHARFVAHLLDPDEYALIETCLKTSQVFQDLGTGGIGGTVRALVDEPGTVVTSLVHNPEIDAVLSAARTMLDFTTERARDIELARIKSIIDPRLADHVRREALKFVDELKRAE
jgi:hypothetical protein